MSSLKALAKRLARLEEMALEVAQQAARRDAAGALECISEAALAGIRDDDTGELVRRYQDAVRSTQGRTDGQS